MERTNAPVPSAVPTHRLALGERALEAQADAWAAQALSRPTARIAGGAEAPAAPAAPGRGGTPLPLALRERFEPCFGVDFGQVRIHGGAGSDTLLQARGALASTLGADIHFGSGRFEPHSTRGLALLAHELAHVAQHAHGTPATWRDKPDPAVDAISPAAAAWYQEVLDTVSLARQRMKEAAQRNELMLTPHGYERHVIVLALCEAVDRRNLDAARQQLKALLDAGLGLGDDILSGKLLNELTARMFEGGLQAEAEQLRTAYANPERYGRYSGDMYRQQRQLDYLARLVAGARSAPKSDTVADIATAMRRFADVGGALQRDYAAQNFEALKQRRPDLNMSPMRPALSAHDYYDALRTVLQHWLEGWSIFVQHALDGARADLESAKPKGSGAARLVALRTALVDVLQPVLAPQSGQRMDTEVFEISKTRLDKPGNGQVVDVFDVAAGSSKPRSVKVTTYNPEQEWPTELRAGIDSALKIRIEQVHQLGLIYGVTRALSPDTKDPAKNQANEDTAKANAQTIAAMPGGRLRLDSDDDWRRFLLQKFHDLTSGAAPLSDGDALTALMNLLFGYLGAFTIHARYTNLYDTGRVPYFNLPFPRTLTGQLVQDCGVYALRAAYMLSLVRHELGLKFWFVRLPAHVELVINGDSGSALPTYVIDNNKFKVTQANELADKRKEWEKFQNPDKTKPAGKTDDTQFIGEMAAADFIDQPVDMAFRITAVPEAGDARSSPKGEQDRLWRDYQASVNPDIFGRASQKKGPNENFHLRYLDLIEDMRAFHNDDAIPFWNIDASPLWDALVQRLSSASGAVASTEVAAALSDYDAQLQKKLAPLQASVDRLRDREKAISDALRADPDLAVRGVRYTSGARATSQFSYYWQLHLQALAKERQQLGKPTAGATQMSAPLLDRIKPQWIPTAERALGRLD